ncbi:hypothetical protein ACFRFL_31270 [Streptomyces sp. NPDC056708]|uniref:hypothetical protein n=1 Tax=unclassified Streptomyces TaxID=2593676 RepID=UPI003675341C
MGSAFLPAVGRRPFLDPAPPWAQRADDLLQWLTPFAGHDGGCGCRSNLPTRLAWPLHRRGLAPEL